MKDNSPKPDARTQSFGLELLLFQCKYFVLWTRNHACFTNINLTYAYCKIQVQLQTFIL